MELSIITCNIVQGLLNLGEQFKDENEQNVVASMVRGMQDLTRGILKGLDSENCLISESCNNIDAFLKLSNKIEEEL